MLFVSFFVCLNNLVSPVSLLYLNMFKKALKNIILLNIDLGTCVCACVRVRVLMNNKAILE